MTKSQFNIKISKDLVTRIKRQAMMSGKSLTEHITDLVTKSLSENVNNRNDYDKLKLLENRLLSVESIVSNREYLSRDSRPFTNKEAINCTKFMKGVLDKELNKRRFENKKQAFEDFLRFLEEIVDMDDFPLDRLKEIMLQDQPSPYTGKELNDLVGDNKCNCPIRKGLINWTGLYDIPSQQEICDKGEKLICQI